MGKEVSQQMKIQVSIDDNVTADTTRLVGKDIPQDQVVVVIKCSDQEIQIDGPASAIEKMLVDAWWEYRRIFPNVEAQEQEQEQTKAQEIEEEYNRNAKLAYNSSISHIIMSIQS